jgi:uncharacterized protein VirK/YbjX
VTAYRPAIAGPLRLLAQQTWRLASHRYRSYGLADALRAVIGAAWLWRYPLQSARLFQEPVLKRCIEGDAQADTLVHASHRGFLVAGLTGVQRIGCAGHHYAHEALNLDGRYLALVYQGEGLAVWRRQVPEHTFTITLCSPHAQRHEGLLSLELRCDGQILHRMAFAWVDAELFGDAALWGPMMLVTRNQSFATGSAHRQAFESAFPHNAPSYFCLAAAQGIAGQLGHRFMAGVCHTDQIAFEPRYAASFQRSYTEFWEQFGGVALRRHAYKLAVPAALKPLGEVKSRHRARARDRRQNWQSIWQSAHDALGPYRLLPAVYRPLRGPWATRPSAAESATPAPESQGEAAAATMLPWP